MTDRQRYPVARNAPNKVVIPVKHVLVLVGGTVDAGNLFEDETASVAERKTTTTHSRGHSKPGEASKDPTYWVRDYPVGKDAHDVNWYWENNPDLRKGIDALTKKYPGLYLFTMHGWSGDNSPVNRRIAGEYGAPPVWWTISLSCVS